MNPAEWMSRFRLTHEQAKLGKLDAAERTTYEGMCEELARSVIRAEGKELPAGVSARQSFTAAIAWQVEVSNLYKTITREASMTGFVATLGSELKREDIVGYELKLGRGLEPIAGQARVVSSMRSGGSIRTTFAFESMSKVNKERLEAALFDAVLANSKL